MKKSEQDKFNERIDELQKEIDLLRSEVRFLKYCWDFKSIMDQGDNNKNQM